LAEPSASGRERRLRDSTHQALVEMNLRLETMAAAWQDAQCRVLLHDFLGLDPSPPFSRRMASATQP
jgi:hypothetical protein